MTASKIQTTPALSSAEAEIIAASEAGKEAVYLKNIIDEIQEKPAMINIKCDASAAVSFANRVGLGRVRHIELRNVWMQEKVQQKIMTFQKVPTAENPCKHFHFI